MMNWKSEFEFTNKQTQVEVCSMTNFSTEEIKSLKNRINFYIVHYSIIIKKLPAKEATLKLENLKKLLYLMDKEINKRISTLNI